MHERAISIVRTLRENGWQAYLVGGCVRDLLLGREPADYDVATDAIPDDVMRIFPETYAVGAQFGVVLVPIPDTQNESVIPSADRTSQSEVASESRNLLFGREATLLNPRHVEVATFRSDIGYSDGRHPDQAPSTRDPPQALQPPTFTYTRPPLQP